MANPTAKTASLKWGTRTTNEIVLGAETTVAWLVERPFAVGMVVAAVTSLIVLWTYLWLSDGPVWGVNKSLVRGDDD